MLRFLTDEDFDGRLTSGLLTRLPDLDLVRVQDSDLMSTADDAILEWAAMENRILITHDRNTMTGFAIARIHTGLPMPGLFVVDQQTSLGRTIDDLETMAAASDMDEWRDQIIFVPM